MLLLAFLTEYVLRSRPGRYVEEEEGERHSTRPRLLTGPINQLQEAAITQLGRHSTVCVSHSRAVTLAARTGREAQHGTHAPPSLT